jgi:hypothetical protein
MKPTFFVIMILLFAVSISAVTTDAFERLVSQIATEEEKLLPLMKAIVNDPEFLSMSYSEQFNILLALNSIFNNQFEPNPNIYNW